MRRKRKPARCGAKRKGIMMFDEKTSHEQVFQFKLRFSIQESTLELT